MNDSTGTVQLLQGMVGELKKYTQPGSRKWVIGTGNFHRDQIVLKLSETEYIRFRLYAKYCKSRISVDKELTGKDNAPEWYGVYIVYL